MHSMSSKLFSRDSGVDSLSWALRPNLIGENIAGTSIGENIGGVAPSRPLEAVLPGLETRSKDFFLSPANNWRRFFEFSWRLKPLEGPLKLRIVSGLEAFSTRAPKSIFEGLCFGPAFQTSPSIFFFASSSRADSAVPLFPISLFNGLGRLRCSLSDVVRASAYVQIT